MKTMAFLNFIFFMVMANFALAQTPKDPVGISLLPVLKELGAIEQATVGVPIRAEEDLKNALSGKLIHTTPLHFHTYPISAFTASSDLSFMAFTLHKAVVPKDQKLEMKVILVRGGEDGVQLHRVISPHRRIPLTSFPTAVRIIGDRYLRIEWTYAASFDGAVAYSDYTFWDLLTEKHYSMEELLPFPEISRSRALSDFFYQVIRRKGKSSVGAIIHFDPLNNEMNLIHESKDQMIVDALDYNSILTWDRDLKVFSQDHIQVRASIPAREGGWRSVLVNIKKDRVTYQNEPSEDADLTPQRMSVENGNGKFITLKDGLLKIFSPEGGPAEIFRVHEDLSEHLIATENGYLGHYNNHPHYGFVELIPSTGQVKELTSPRFRLIHWSMANSQLIGVGELNRQSGDVRVFQIPLPSAANASPAGIPVGRNGRFRAISRVFNTHFVMAQRPGDDHLYLVDLSQEEKAVGGFKPLSPIFVLTPDDKRLSVEYPLLRRTQWFNWSDLRKGSWDVCESFLESPRKMPPWKKKKRR